MRDLDDLRKDIDSADKAIVPAFEARMEAARRIAEYKRERGLPIYQPDREKRVVEKVTGFLRDPRNAPALKKLYETMFLVSRAAQEPTARRAAYPGAEGSFSEKALRGYAGEDCARVACETFEDAARAVADGACDIAVLPIENSTAGTVPETYDMLVRWNLFVTGERLERIEHFLLGAPGATMETVREVRSHPQALSQCRDFLRGRAWRETPSVNTAVSAREVARMGDLSVAAIADEDAAKRYGLTVLARNIESSGVNATRFIAVSRAPSALEYGKASVVFRVADKVGALGRALECFARQGLSLCALQSRPVPDAPWEYAFYADFAPCEKSALQRALDEAREYAAFARILGVYPREEAVS